MEVKNIPEVNFYPIDTVPDESEKVLQTNSPAVAPTSNIVSSPNGSIVKDGTLQSPNFSAGNAGWQFDSNGDIEVNNGTFRGNIIMGTTSYIRGGQTAYNTGTGFFLGYSGSAYKFSVGSPTGDYLTWDGTNLTVSASKIVKLFTAGMALTAGQVVFMHTDGKVYSGDAGYAGQTNKAFGICLTTTALNANAPIQTFGTASGLSSLTIASTYYLQDATQTKDQENTTSTGAGGTMGNGTESTWQSFTTGASVTNLSKITLLMSSAGGTGNVTVLVRVGEGTGGALVGTLTGTAPTGGATDRVCLPGAPITLSSNTVYTLSFYSSRSDTSVAGADSNPYAGGRNDASASNDYVFCTYKSTARGALGTSAGTVSKIMGFATSATELQLNYQIT